MEVWKPVVGHEGLYEVSDLGRVRSLDREQVYERVDQYSGRVITIVRKHRGRLLRPGRMTGGHLSVSLGRNNSVCVHILVLNAFVSPCPEGHECCHSDDVPSNNVLENLRWGTRRDNMIDAIRTGHRAIGENHRNAKLMDADIPIIRSLFDTMSLSEIAKRYGVGEATIRQIKNGKTWKHAGQQHAA